MNTEITKHTDRKAMRGWIFYDAACKRCVQGQKRTGRLFESRGFEWLPLQSPGAAARLGVSELAFEIRMHLLMADGRVFNNADAFGVLCRTVWWLWPMGALLLVPGFRKLGRLIYDWFARNRYRFGGTCEIDPAPAHITVLHQPYWQRALPLIVLPVLVFVFLRNEAAWVFMWALAFAVFAGCKWLTYRTAVHHGLHDSLPRTLGYLIAWPGMDAEAFLRNGHRVPRPHVARWILTAANIVFGIALVWIMARGVLPFGAVAAGWIGMTGIVFILHFGLFRLLSLAWQAAGVDAALLMRAPILATSLSKFWGRRWNSAFHELGHRFTFRPICRATGATGATLIVFALSGLIHELLISVPARGGYGLPLAYFLIQGLGIVGEHTTLGRRMGLGHGVRGWLFTMVMTAGPAFLLFHSPFIHNVILPMLEAIGAL